MGQAANNVRAAIEQRLEQCKEKLQVAALNAKLASEALDVTVPGKPVRMGHRHPMNVSLEELKNIFIGMGFAVDEGNEIELSTYNFDRLNTDEGHPAREWTDTFYLDENSETLLRTHTSPMEPRIMESHELPIRYIVPGRCYRKDEVDATHSPMFHQMEGLVVDSPSRFRGRMPLPPKRPRQITILHSTKTVDPAELFGRVIRFTLFYAAFPHRDRPSFRGSRRGSPFYNGI